jgi:pyruvate dehydrogenase E1 component
MRVRGFLLGGTAGRTTLNGEGLQHQDGHSHLAAAATPNIKAYDLAYAYEIAIVVQKGIQEMVEEDLDALYYLTLENENYCQPKMPEKIEEGIIKGLYKLKDLGSPQVNLFGSGPLLGEAIAAANLLKEDWNIGSSVWSVTSFSELRKEAEAIDRWNLNHSEKKPKQNYIQKSLGKNNLPIVAVSDYMKMVSDQIRPYISGSYLSLGTDGFGRSETRESLRNFFEVDRYYIVLNAVRALTMSKNIDVSVMQSVMKKYKLDPEKPNPTTV